MVIFWLRLVLQCREIKTPGAVIERYIHFWLGANITSDRSKSAAYKIIELDLHLDHKTTQYRESQGHEGIRFLSYFKDDGILLVLISFGFGFLTLQSFPIVSEFNPERIRHPIRNFHDCIK